MDMTLFCLLLNTTLCHHQTTVESVPICAIGAGSACGFFKTIQNSAHSIINLLGAEPIAKRKLGYSKR
jgi:hypothetical protein